MFRKKAQAFEEWLIASARTERIRARNFADDHEHDDAALHAERADTYEVVLAKFNQLSS